jgi:hypothetical protein
MSFEHELNFDLDIGLNICQSRGMISSSWHSYPKYFIAVDGYGYLPNSKIELIKAFIIIADH